MFHIFRMLCLILQASQKLFQNTPTALGNLKMLDNRDSEICLF